MNHEIITQNIPDEDTVQETVEELVAATRVIKRMNSSMDSLDILMSNLQEANDEYQKKSENLRRKMDKLRVELP